MGIIGAIIFCLRSTDALAENEHMAALGVRELPRAVKVPNFILNDLRGHAVSFEEFRGKVVQLNFWATW